MPKLLDPIPPGEILLEGFLKPLGISQDGLARDLKVPPARINDIVHRRRAITADTALRLSRYFRMTAEFRANLHAHYDLKMARRALGAEIERSLQPIEPVARAA